MHYRTVLSIFIIMLGLAGNVTAQDKATQEAKKVDYQANLEKIPGTDPAAQVVIPVVKDLIGQHPRLLFTTKDIEALRANMETDALLKQAGADTVTMASRFPLEEGKPKFLSEDTPAIWKAGGTYTGLAYAYHLSKDATIKAKILSILTLMLEQPYWSDTSDLDSNMGAGNNMLMVGLLYDAVCTELEPEFRTKLAAKILTHVRRMWYLGHQQLAVGTIKYWQQDPLNNHRWHRNAGLAACLLSIADEPGLETAYMLEQFAKEMKFVVSWLPHDGDTHEGAGYQEFGFMYLALAVRMMDRVLGTTHQQSPALRNAWMQQVYFWAPGRGGNMSFGDDSNGNGGGFGYLDGAFFIGPQLTRDAQAQAALLHRMKTKRAYKPDDLLPWTLLAFYDPTVNGGDHQAVPPYRLFADVGTLSVRDNWSPNGVALTFKSAPYGGYKLNEFAWHTGKQTYINVAHDDPDANAFTLTMAGDFIFHPGGYSMPKKTDTCSTLLVNGKGQVNEGQTYTQPVPDIDMRTLSYLTGWKTGEAGRLIVEGETGKAYQGQLSRYRRTTIWMPGEYVLLLDDVVAVAPSALTWNGISEKGELIDATQGRGVAGGLKGKTVEFQVVASEPLVAAITTMKLEGRRGDTELRQFTFTATASAARFACALDPWGTKPTVTLVPTTDGATVTVTIAGVTDTWTWRSAADQATPSVIDGKRGGQLLVALTASDVAPTRE